MHLGVRHPARRGARSFQLATLAPSSPASSLTLTLLALISATIVAQVAIKRRCRAVLSEVRTLASETGLAGWAERTRTQKCRGKISL